MSSSDRGGALARRKVRIAGYIREGRTVGEICDLEGLDPANEPKRMRKEIAEPNGLKISPGRNNKPPVGLLDFDRQIRVNLKEKLATLRDDYHYVDVAQMIGMTNIEQQRALTDPYTHNWTLAQIQRLAVALGMTFEEMLDHMRKPAPIDFRKLKR